VTAVRRALPEDADAVALSELENLGADAWSANLVSEGVRGQLPMIHYLVAEDASLVVGHAVASVAGEVVELQRIAVAAAYRRTGVASALLDAVVAVAVGAGAERLLLEVREDNPGAQGFYAARGFSEVGRRERYYRDGTTAVVMERYVEVPA
jgi:[ribosomal protein S18]-alanine N-acetyltransferase